MVKAKDPIKLTIAILTILSFVVGTILFVAAAQNKANDAYELANENKIIIKTLSEAIHNIDVNLAKISVKLDGNAEKVEEIKNDIKDIKKRIK